METRGYLNCKMKKKVKMKKSATKIRAANGRGKQIVKYNLHSFAPAFIVNEAKSATSFLV